MGISFNSQPEDLAAGSVALWWTTGAADPFVLHRIFTIFSRSFLLTLMINCLLWAFFYRPHQVGCSTDVVVSLTGHQMSRQLVITPLTNNMRKLFASISIFFLSAQVTGRQEDTKVMGSSPGLIRTSAALQAHTLCLDSVRFVLVSFFLFLCFIFLYLIYVSVCM